MKNLFLILFGVIIMTNCNSVDVNGIDLDSETLPTATFLESGVNLSGLIDTRWILENMDGNDLIAGTLISLQVGSMDFSGSAGCNNYSAKYNTKSESHYVIEEIALNQEECHEPKGIMEQEKEYENLLQSSVSTYIADHKLILEDEQGKPILRYKPRQKFDVTPDILIGKTWQLVSATGLEPDFISAFTLKFDEDTFSGTSICRDYVGEYQAIGDGIQVTFMSMGADKNCNENETRAEGHYTTLLSEAEQFNGSFQKLEIYSRRGEELIFALAESE